jgi:O-acetyl-ADP-ribose deacetylase (regulator of RNase III)
MIEVRIGRLEDMDVEAVLRPVSSEFAAVNPAGSRFREAAGAAVVEQCRQVGELPVGSAAITAAGALTARFIVHAAIRSADENVTSSIVKRALLNGLRRLDEWGIRTVAVAPLGTGAGNLDAEEAAEAMLPTLAQHLRGSEQLSRVILVVEDEYQQSAFSAAVARCAPELAGTGS